MKLLDWLARRTWRRPVTLVCMRLDHMIVTHPDQDNSRQCAACGAAVGIYPSGQQILHRYGTRVHLVCHVCHLIAGGSTLYPAPGALEEAGQGS